MPLEPILILCGTYEGRSKNVKQKEKGPLKTSSENGRCTAMKMNTSLNDLAVGKKLTGNGQVDGIL